MEGQRPDRAAVGKRLMDGEVEAVVSALELGAVERASAPRDREPPARVALPGLVLGALLVEQRLDAGVRGGLERLLPARGGAAAAPGLLSPALDYLALLVRARFLEQRQRDRKQVGRRGVASALVQPTIAFLTSFESMPSNSARVSSEATTTTRGVRSCRTRLSSASATSRRWSSTSFSMCRW